MKKLIVMCAGGLILGMAGGTGAAWLRRPPAAEPERIAAEAARGTGIDDVAEPDLDAAADDDGAVDGVMLVRADTEPVPLTGPGEAVSASPRPSAATSNNGEQAGGNAVGPGGASPRTGGAVEPTDVERLSQIFGTMKPQEAARVLERLDDAQVRSLLLGLPDRKAAAILASLPAERAAALTRSIMVRNEP